MKRFEEYLKSPFLNKNVRIIRLFELIKKFHPAYDDPDLSKEKIKKLLDIEGSKDSYLRNLFSDLNEKAEEYLSYVNYKNDSDYNTHLIRELYSRESARGFEEKLGFFEKLIEKKKFRSPSYYHDRAFVSEMKTNSKVNSKLVERSRREDIENKFYFFVISILESYCQTFIEQQRANIDHDFSILKHLLDYLQKNIAGFRKEPLIEIYYYACLCFLNGYSEDHFNDFINLYNLNKKQVSHIDRRNINSLILTYYGEKNKTESGRYYRDALTLYSEMIDDNYLSHTQSGHIDLIAVRNIIFLCMNLKDKKFFASFIKRINDVVHPDQRKEIYLYANSLYNIMLDDFENALPFLSEINFNSFLETVDDNLYFKNDIKKYTIICLIELGYFENALVHIDSYRHYLNYSGIIPKEMKLRNLSFLNLLNEVVVLKMKFDDFKSLKLEKKILQAGEMNVYFKEWLLKKCTDIRKERSGE